MSPMRLVQLSYKVVFSCKPFTISGFEGCLGLELAEVVEGDGAGLVGRGEQDVRDDLVKGLRCTFGIVAWTVLLEGR